MDTVIIGLILAIWTFLVLPAVMIQFLPRNPESQPQRASRAAGPFSFISPKTPRDTSGGRAIA